MSMSLFNELKRRNVFRVGAAYVIGAWLLAQIADLLIDNIGAPDWVMKTLFVVLALGFFLALFFAWAFEMTPDGVKRESEVDRSQSITKVTGRKMDRSIIFVLVLALGYFAWDKFSAQPQTLAAVEQTMVEELAIDKSIAVLPFVNMSADADNEYFSDGLSEELLNLLAKVDGLKVAARTSSFKFKKSEADIGEIGKQLNVATVLEGSVRKSGNQARITAQLIKVDDGFHLWSETYDRELDNIFEVQDEIAKAIVEALKLPLLGHDAQPLASTSTENFAAYDLYLLGRHEARQYSETSFKRAIDYYLASLEKDPLFAPAYSGLADGYIFLANFGDLPQGEAQNLARTAAEKAISISPDSSEAHASMGLLLFNLNHYHKAETHFLQALQINPNNVNALMWYDNNLTRQFRSTEAMSMINRAMSVDPLSHAVRRNYASTLARMLRFDEAVKEIQSFIAVNPEDPTPYEVWGTLFQQQGRPQNAIPMYRNAHRLRPGDIFMAARNVTSGLQLNDKQLVDDWLEEARSRGADGQWTRYAENLVMYANGNFANLLSQVDQLLVSQPGQVRLLGYRHAALMNMGQVDKARETLQQSMEYTGHLIGQPLSGGDLFTAVYLANVLDVSGNTDERDQLLSQASELLTQLRQSEPANSMVFYLSANVASIRNDLPGLLRQLESASQNGFRNHWELIRNPVFARWQDNEEFKAFYQGMLKNAAEMLREYKSNNPDKKSSSTTGAIG
jgi:TolB-like protein/predicted Zn-dependent protease